MDPNLIVVQIYNVIIALIPHAIIFIKGFFGFLVGFSLVLSLFFFISIIYSVEGLKKIRKKEEQIYDVKVEPAFEEGAAGDTAMAHRWDNATKLINSSNPNDWKQAIIEADIILDDLLTKMGYQGESVGEKLKRVATGDMKTLDDAWEAHKIRNRIAHEPGFALDQHTATHTIHLYKKVFEEFYYI